MAFAHCGGSFPATLGRIEHGWRCRPDLLWCDCSHSHRHSIPLLTNHCICTCICVVLTMTKTLANISGAFGSIHWCTTQSCWNTWSKRLVKIKSCWAQTTRFRWVMFIRYVVIYFVSHSPLAHFICVLSCRFVVCCFRWCCCFCCCCCCCVHI